MYSETTWQSTFKSFHFFHENYVDLKSFISEVFFCCCYCCLSCPQINTAMTMGGNIVHVHDQCLNKVQYQMLLVLTWHHMLYKHRTHYRHGSHSVRLTCFQSWGLNYKAATLWEDWWGYLHNHNHYHFQKCQFANFANCM